MNTEPIETSAVEAVRKAPIGNEAAVLAHEAEEIGNALAKAAGHTAAQARIDAVANVLHKAYENASMLRLTDDEEAALTADFDDADFRTGAAGKENLLYIEHASLRQRLNKVLGVGQWALVARNRWTEPVGQQDQRVYVEAVLIVRGCFVAETVGDMTYYPRNNITNFGDAVEGATSAALRRCAKGLGVGLQAWKDDFCDGWFARNRNGKRPAPAPQRLEYLRPAPQTQVSAARPADDEGGFDAAAPKTPPAASPAASMAPSQQETPEERKERFISVFKPYGDASTQVFRIRGLVLDTESFQDIDTVKIGLLSRANVTALLEEVKQVHGGKEPPVVSEGDERLPDDLHDPADYSIPHPDSEPWRKLIVPFGKNKGIQLGELPKGSLKFYVCDWVPKPHEFKGKMYQPKESDMVFYKTLQRYAKEIIQRYGYDREDRRD